VAGGAPLAIEGRPIGAFGPNDQAAEEHQHQAKGEGQQRRPQDAKGSHASIYPLNLSPAGAGPRHRAGHRPGS
jgi:hypothetical protein